MCPAPSTTSLINVLEVLGDREPSSSRGYAAPPVWMKQCYLSHFLRHYVYFYAD